MAGTITHAYFALDVYNKFDDKLKERLKNYKENLKTYSQGPDILFFSINYKNFKKVKDYYDDKLWDERRVRLAVGRWITAEEYKEITGKDYE